MCVHQVTYPIFGFILLIKCSGPTKTQRKIAWLYGTPARNAEVDEQVQESKRGSITASAENDKSEETPIDNRQQAQIDQ